MAIYVGLDIGGTKCMAAASGDSGKPGPAIKSPTPLDLDEGLVLLHRMIGEVSGGQKIAGIGAAAGGPLDWRTGVVSPLHQPQWRDVPLKQIVEKRWQCPFHVDVDTNVAALGEYHASPDRPARFLYLTLSTGMGGGFLIDGQIYRGQRDEHPEVGHQAIPFRCRYPERVRCACGNADCLEGLICGTAIERIYLKPAPELTADEWAEVAWNLGQGLRNLAAIYTPDVIAIGGGIAHGQGQSLLSIARQVMRDHLKIIPAPEVRLSHLGYDSALVGALQVARNGLDLVV